MNAEHDLEVVSDDLAFGPDDEPVFLNGTAVVAQDIRHRLRASGLPLKLLGAAPGERTRLRGSIAREAEEDERIWPGSARAEEPEPGRIAITARTLDGAPIAPTTQG